jgi:hypothetical protein
MHNSTWKFQQHILFCNVSKYVKWVAMIQVLGLVENEEVFVT